MHLPNLIEISKDKYGNAILKNSDMGYMICNFYLKQSEFKNLIDGYLGLNHEFRIYLRNLKSA